MSISTTMVSFMCIVSFMSVRLSFLFDESFEIAELVLPHVAVAREPVVDVLERLGVELVETVASDLDLGDEPGLAQDAQMPGNRRTADREIAGDAAGWLATLPQQGEDGAPSRIGERLEHIAIIRFIGNHTITHYIDSRLCR